MNDSLAIKMQPSSDQFAYLSSLFAAKGYNIQSIIARSLQGCVLCLSKNDVEYVAKVSSQVLYMKKVSVVAGKEVRIEEDIVKESQILKYLSSQTKAPDSLAKFVEAFQNESYIVLVTEHAGTRLFDFVTKCHELITRRKLRLDTYLGFVQKAFAQIVSLMDWMHNTMKCCHLDLSLENLTIYGLEQTRDMKDQSIIHSIDGFQIKVIDFGLAELYGHQLSGSGSDVDYFASVKYVGKKQYKAPEVYARAPVYDARSADVWSLGMILYIMTVGNPPFSVPSITDQYYLLFKQGRIRDMLVAWHKESYSTPQWMNLITRIFVDEKDRIKIKQISKHAYVAGQQDASCQEPHSR